MFTGIVEEIGTIIEFIKLGTGALTKIRCSGVLAGTKTGDSISVNGCCLTVTEVGGDYFAADVSDETLNISNFKYLKIGSVVNLERALTPSTRMGGHIVQGHIDGTANFIFSEKLADFYNLTFELPVSSIKYIVQKGSIAINGVSLTVANISGNILKTSVIPHTYKNTTLSKLKNNEIVNIETDILARYIEKFLLSDNNNRQLNVEFLKENGFI